MFGRHVAVLMGGLSSERPVSLSSGNACAGALETLGYRVSRVDVGRDIASVLTELKPDVAFNALHGPFGEDGTVQGILEYLEIPYTHSGLLASALAMDKGQAKIVAAAAGVKIADALIMDRNDIGHEHPIAPPYVIKPVAEGSSFGVIIVQKGASNPPQSIHGDSWKYGDRVMVERFIPGRELTCAVMGDRSLGVTEIIPIGQEFYDFDAKYKNGGSKHQCPAELSPSVYQDIEKMAVEAHRAIGCRGVSRSDFRYDENGNNGGKNGHGEVIWLEVNTQPGMTPTSLVPELANHAGMSFAELVDWIVKDASCGR